jgi:hypothetical protein
MSVLKKLAGLENVMILDLTGTKISDADYKDLQAAQPYKVILR